MINIGKSRFLIILALLTLLAAGCSREFEDLVSAPIDDSMFPPTPSGLSAEIGDGKVFLTWNVSDTALVTGYNIYRADSVIGGYVPIGSSAIRSFTADDLQNGRVYHFKVSSINGAGYEGYMSDPVSAIPELYSISINNGDEYTNNRDVILIMTAPVGTRLMQVSVDSTFVGDQWETFAASRDFHLEGGDEVKTIYCRFRDVADRTTWGYFNDSITLDTESFIDSVVFSPPGPFSPGEVVHFAVYAGEPGGEAQVAIGTEITGLVLYDNGQRGDAIADDGVYELDFDIPGLFDFENRMVSGQFTDRAGNAAPIMQANSRLSVRRAPDPVNLFSVNAPPGSHDRLDLNWELSGAQDFAQYRIYRDVSPGVDSTSFLAASVLSSGSTSLSDTGLTENTQYYYKVYVVDITGLWSGSNEAGAVTGPDSPPAAVDLYPVIVEPDHYSQIDLEWSQSPENDFESYRLYRWQENIGRSDSVLAAFITDRTGTEFVDEPLFSTSEDTLNFWYILHLYDHGGHAAPSDSVRVHLVDAVPPTVSGSVSSSDSSLIITWIQSGIPDFGNYRLLRDTDSNPSGAITVFVSSGIGDNVYDDDSTIEGQTYYYWLDIIDLRGNSSRSVLGSGAW